jgi:hypothetical protein
MEYYYEQKIHEFTTCNILTLSITTIPAVAYESENEAESYDANNVVDENDIFEDGSMNVEDSKITPKTSYEGICKI